MHGTTAANPEGETSVLLVLGVVSQVLGGAGLGLAVRLEHQQTAQTALGIELAGGRGEADSRKVTLFALRGYGRGSPRGHDWVAIGYGAGVSFLDTGMTTLTSHGGVAVSYVNDYFEPYLGAGLALAVPLSQGETFGDMDDDTAIMVDPGPPHPISGTPRGVATNVYLTIDPGFVVPVGHSGHDLSLDLGFATGLGRSGAFFTASLADRRE